MSFRKTLLGLIGSLAVSSQLIAGSFEEGYQLMQQSMPEVDRNVSVEQFFVPAQKRVDDRGNELFSYEKQIGGVKVFGEKKLIVFPKQETEFAHLENLRSMTAEDIEFVKTHKGLRPEPVLTQDQATNAAIRDLRQKQAYISTPLPKHLQRATELVMYKNSSNQYRLVYHITLPGQIMMQPSAFDYFVDAETGAIVDKAGQLYDITGKGIDLTEGKTHSFPVEEDKAGFRMEDKARNLHVYNGSAGKFSTDEDNMWDKIGTMRKENQRAEVELFVNMVRTVDYFKGRHNFIWKEGKTPVKATAHVRDNFNNAYYSSWEGGFFFGDGSGDDDGFDYLTKGLDVAAHEFTHGVIDLWCPLTYNGESGALNEHIADFFGAMVDSDDWHMGDNITIGDNPSLRNMQDPTRGMGDLIPEGMIYADWAQLSKTHGFKGRIYPDRVSKKIICNGWGEDNGGVHINSSIFNKFAYMATTGNEVQSEGLGHDLMADIYMRVLKNRMLSSRASFTEFRDRFLAAADLHLQGHAKRDVYLATINQAFRKIDL
jgi:bacillolysin